MVTLICSWPGATAEDDRAMSIIVGDNLGQIFELAKAAMVVHDVTKASYLLARSMAGNVQLATKQTQDLTNMRAAMSAALQGEVDGDGNADDTAAEKATAASTDDGTAVEQSVTEDATSSTDNTEVASPETPGTEGAPSSDGTTDAS